MWWRAQNNCVDHAKLIKLNDRGFRNWFNLMCVASENGGILPDLETIAIKLRISQSRAATALGDLVTAKLFDLRQDGKYEPHDWDTWQFKTKEDSDDGVTSSSGEHRGKYVYFVGTIKIGGPIKIGISKNPWARIGELQTSYPDKLALLASFKTRGPSEADLHVLLARFRRQGEWFNLPSPIMDLVLSAYNAKSDYASLLLLLRSSYVVKPDTETYSDKKTLSTVRVERGSSNGVGETSRLSLSPQALETMRKIGA